MRTTRQCSRRCRHPMSRSNASAIYSTTICLGCRRPPRNWSEGDTMKATKKLHDLGQSLWLDNITRELLNSGTLKRYIDELSVTGLTSNPTIFDNAIKNSAMYDDDISRAASGAASGEELFFP